MSINDTDNKESVPTNKNTKEEEEENNTNTPEKKLEFSKIIGSYILFDQIGKGSFSKVTKAIHLITEQVVAVKILEKEKIEDEIDVERISREIEILKTIMHPNIAQMYESFSTIHNIYLMMEYAEGGDLFDYISNKNFLSEIEACNFYRQIIGVLEYLIEMGISHRDIKPENILLNKEQTQIKVIDFGLSNYCQKNEFLESSCGSPCYASPEMLSGKPYKGVTTDLWSSGVVLYCMLVGSLPFDDQELSVLYDQIKKGKFYLPSTLSMDAIDLLKKILEVNPNKRITIKQLKQHNWFNISKNIIYKSVIYTKGNYPCDNNIVNYAIKNYFIEDDIKMEDYCKMIKNHESNKYTATYFLVKKYILNKDEFLNSKTINNNKTNLSISNKNITVDTSIDKKTKKMSSRCKTEENINIHKNNSKNNNNKNTNNKNTNNKTVLSNDKNSNNNESKNKQSCDSGNRINNSNIKVNIPKLELKNNKSQKDKAVTLKPQDAFTEPNTQNSKINNSKNKKSIRQQLLNMNNRNILIDNRINKKNILYIKGKNNEVKHSHSPNEENMFRNKMNTTHNFNKNNLNLIPKIDLSNVSSNGNKINIHLIHDMNNKKAINYNKQNTLISQSKNKKLVSTDNKNKRPHQRNLSTSVVKNKMNFKTNGVKLNANLFINKNIIEYTNNYKKIVEKNMLKNKLLAKSIDNNDEINYKLKNKNSKPKKIKKDILTFREKNKDKKWILNTEIPNNLGMFDSERTGNSNVGYCRNFNVTNNLVLNQSLVNNFYYNKGNGVNSKNNISSTKNVKNYYSEKYDKGNFNNSKNKSKKNYRQES